MCVSVSLRDSLVRIMVRIENQRSTLAGCVVKREEVGRTRTNEEEEEGAALISIRALTAVQSPTPYPPGMNVCILAIIDVVVISEGEIFPDLSSRRYSIYRRASKLGTAEEKKIHANQIEPAT